MDDNSSEAAARVLADVVPRLGRVIAGALDSHPELQLSLRQFRILERVSTQPRRMGDLASTSEISQPTASVATTSLEEHGLVRRAVDPTDRRAALIEITDEGRGRLEVARKYIMERLRIVTRDFLPEHVETLRELQPILEAGMDVAREELRAQAESAGKQRRS